MEMCSDAHADLPLDTDNENQLVLSWDVVRTILLGQDGIGGSSHALDRGTP